MKSEEQIRSKIAETDNQQLNIAGVSVSVLSDEEMREPIQNALYATRHFLTDQCTELADGILDYLKDAGYIIVRTER